jgi:nucleotide-binding universal stress UspA family protein
MKILLATDGSECSDLAINVTASRPWPPGSEVRIIAAAEGAASAAVRDGMPPDQAAEVGRYARVHAESLAKRAVELFQAENRQQLPVNSIVVVDSAKDAILDEAERWGADLIVVGSHGYRGSNRFLLGSVSQAVAAQAKCSVEIVRDPLSSAG